MDQPNRKCSNMLIRRYVRMRAYFEAKRCAPVAYGHGMQVMRCMTKFLGIA